MVCAVIGIDSPVPRWSSSTSLYSFSTRLIQPLLPIGRGDPAPGPPWKKTIYGKSAFSFPAAVTTRAKTRVFRSGAE